MERTTIWLSNKAQHKLGEAVYREFKVEYDGFTKTYAPFITLQCEICKKEMRNYHLFQLNSCGDEYITFRVCNECFKKEIKVIESERE